MRSIFVVVFSMILFFLSSDVLYADGIAVIVNKDNALDEVSFRDLVKIFKQEKQYWAPGNKIYLIIQETGTIEKEIVLKRIYKMNDVELKKFWLGNIYRGKISSFPKTLSSNESVKRFVSQVSRAIGFIDSSFVDESIKVLRIDGKLPEDRDYILADGVKDED